MSEEQLFQQLNDNFRAEIAIHVNLGTLKKVKMFEKCDPGFLRELVLKLKLMLCSPGKINSSSVVYSVPPSLPGTFVAQSYALQKESCEPPKKKHFIHI